MESWVYILKQIDLELLLLWFLAIFQQNLVRKSSGSSTQLQKYTMVKQIKRGSYNKKKQQKKQKSKESQISKTQNVQKGIKYLKFFSFLKYLHQRIRKQSFEKTDNFIDLKEITDQLMIFFNVTRKYTQNQLDISIICLANLLTFIRNELPNLEFQKEFKNKLKHFLPTLQLQHKDYPENHESKITAVFYILAVLICKQHVTLSQQMIDLNKAIYSDSTLVKSLLSISIIPEVRLSKFYGIVLQYLSNKIYSKKEKEILIKSIIFNFKNIRNQSTLLSLLIYLRMQKNKIKISFEDVVKGEIIQLLMELYPKYIDKHQSTYILDYLHHLILLFPQLSYKIINHNFLTFLIEQTQSREYHPLQQIPLLNLVHFALSMPSLSKIDKPIFLDLCMDFILNKSSFSFKLLQIVIQYDINVHKLMRWLQNEGFDCLVEMMKRQSDDNSLLKVAKICLKVIKKVKIMNEAIGIYLKFQLSQRLKLLEHRRINGMQLIELLNNTHLQY